MQFAFEKFTITYYEGRVRVLIDENEVVSVPLPQGSVGFGILHLVALVVSTVLTVADAVGAIVFDHVGIAAVVAAVSGLGTTWFLGRLRQVQQAAKEVIDRI